MPKKLSAQYPEVMKCVRGEEWPAGSFQTLVSYKDQVITHESITILCPAGHEFTLKRGVRDGWVSPADALTIIEIANKELPGMKKEAAKFKRKLKGR